jgi:HD-GYP domain-containing protein (c-di-GMP phosphodiesterase class II)
VSEDLTTLTLPISDIDGNQVAPAGVTVGRDFLAAIAGKGRPNGAEASLDETEIPADLAAFAGEPELAGLFDSEIAGRVRGLCAKVAVPEPVLRELIAMRDNMPLYYHHALATTAITLRLCLEMTVKSEELVKIARGVLLKDIGMTRIPTTLVRNRDFLTRQEFHQISKHPIIGLVLNTWYFGEGLEGMIALRHHIRSGRGYPRWPGLKPSRLIDIIEVVDVFYALLSPRPFRPEPYDVRGALDELTTMAERGEIGADALRLLVAGFRSEKPAAHEVSLSGERHGFVPQANFYGLGDS